MLHEGAEYEPSYEHDAYGNLQPLAVRPTRHHQQEGIDSQQHGSEHQQDVGNQDACRHIVTETNHDRLILQIVLTVDGQIILQFAGYGLYGQSCLPLTILPTEVDAGIIV